MGPGAGSWLDARWVGEIRNLVEVTPEENERRTDAEEHQRCPKTDIVEGLPHTHPVRQFLSSGFLVPCALSHKVHSIHTAADLRGCSTQVLAEGGC